MDGKELLYRLRHLLNEDSNSAFLDSKTAYTYLWDAVTKFVERTNYSQSNETITTVADQSTYDLSADFLKPYLMDDDNRLFLHYNDGSDNHIIYWRDYHQIRSQNTTTSVSIPTGWAIIDEAAIDSRISGTATSDGAASAGECNLTDTAADFSGVEAGDTVHNVTDGSDGVVLSVTSSTVLVTALFGGTNNDWSTSDSYVVRPQAKLALVLDPPPESGGHTITLGKIQRPAPVFSNYGAYRVQSRAIPAILHYAAWLFKYRDSSPDTGDRFYQFFDSEVRQLGNQINISKNRGGFTMNMKKRRN